MRDMFSQHARPERRRTPATDSTRFAPRCEELNAELERQAEESAAAAPVRSAQADRLADSAFSTRGAGALTSGDLAETLNLTDEQREKLEKRAAEVQEELQDEDSRSCRLEARKKMLDVLTPEQQAKLKTMMGDAFDMPEQQLRRPVPRPRRRDGGGRRRRRPTAIANAATNAMKQCERT